MAQNLVIPNGFGTPSKLASEYHRQLVTGGGGGELSSGVTSGYAVLTFRGKTWRVKHRGEERTIMRKDNDREPASSVDVVVVKASRVISKIWYEDAYQSGSSAPPDCFSINGQTPDPASPKKQCATCAACPRNVWGSKVGASGKPTKECGDSKRLAVVPLMDIRNEVYGGPMLLRVPAASLGDMASYGNRLEQMGFPTFAVGTRIRFDPDAEFPRLAFEPARALDDNEVAQIISFREDAMVDRMLSDATDLVQADSADPKPAPGASAAQAFANLQAQKAAQEAARAAPTAKPAAPEPVAVSPRAAAQEASKAEATPAGKWAPPAGSFPTADGGFFVSSTGTIVYPPADEPEPEPAWTPPAGAIAAAGGGWFDPAQGKIIFAPDAAPAQATPEPAKPASKPRATKAKAEAAAQAAPAPVESTTDAAVANTGLSAIDDELEALMNS
jgi:hypothetical protein